MNRTTASYFNYVCSWKTFEHDVIAMLKSTQFSLNMDESTNNIFQRVVTILISFYCPVMKQVKICHFGSRSCVNVKRETLYDAFVNMIERNGIPWRNLILMNSCNVIRGSKVMH